MLIEYKGPTIGVVLDPNESESGFVNITLPDGYSYEQIKIIFISNIDEILPYCRATTNTSIKYPPINSMSPCILILHIIDTKAPAACGITIEKFGQIADPHYFDSVAKPISVTGEDGNKYKVIPSDQFK